ncbi:hypothetical protein QMK38_16250 [Lysinibacillus fusiformis]|nr:hypothetical protein [Lysinibacillus fusiformis]
MRFIFYITSLISGIITIWTFSFINSLTASFDPSGGQYGGGNGNPALFFMYTGGIFILYFFVSLLFMLNSFHARQTNKIKLILFTIYSVLSVFTFTRMIWSAINLKIYINDHHPYMEVGLINQFSNNLFFNTWTFIGLVALTAALSFVLPQKVLR